MSLFSNKEQQEAAKAKLQAIKDLAVEKAQELDAAKTAAKEAAAYAAQMAKEAKKARKEDKEAAQVAAQMAKEAAVDAAKTVIAAEQDAKEAKIAAAASNQWTSVIIVTLIIGAILWYNAGSKEEAEDYATSSHPVAEKLEWQEYNLEKRTANGLTRGSVWIVIDKSQTAAYRKKVLDYMKTTTAMQNNIDYLKVFLVPSPKLIGTGYLLGDTVYCQPKKCHELNMSADNNPAKASNQQLTSLQIQVAEEYFALWIAPQFQTKQGVDEEKIFREIAKKLNISAKEAKNNFIPIFY